MPKIPFIPYDISYKIENNLPVIELIGLSKKEKVNVQITHFSPYFLIKLKEDQKITDLNKTYKIEDKNIEIIKTQESIKNVKGKKTTFHKIFINDPKNIPHLSKKLKEFEYDTYEYDISFVKRFLIDQEINLLDEYEVEGEYVNSSLRIKTIKAEKLSFKSDKKTNFPIVAFDIETFSKNIDPRKTPIHMIAIYGKNYKKVIGWGKPVNLDYVDIVENEKELLLLFNKIIVELDPTIITGYYSDVFDMQFIKIRAKVNKIDLDFGTDYSGINISKGKTKNARVKGMIHIDIFKFIRYILGPTLEASNYDLDSIASFFLNANKKKIVFEDYFDSKGKDLEKYFEYNLVDTELTYKLTEKFIPLISELAKLTKSSLYDASRSRYSKLVESYLLLKSKEFEQVIPKLPSHESISKRKYKRFQGAFVYQPKPGLYENVAVFDFSSLYPTLISAYNISPETLDEDNKFTQKFRGFIPKVIKELIIRRQRIKELIKEKPSKYLDGRSYALKTLANAMYGYLGFFGSRFYCFDCANEVTLKGREQIQDVINILEEKKYEIIYGDTDSIFVYLDKKKTEPLNDIVSKINEKLPDLMELSIQDIYPKAIFVAAKGSLKGAKKKYALITKEDKIVIKGFAAIRRNWSKLAKEVQKEVLKIILTTNDTEKALKYIKEIIADLRSNKVPTKKMSISTQITKPIDDYDSIGPHVAVAIKLRNKGIEVKPGDIIKYIVKKGAGRIGDKSYPEDSVSQEEYDGEYYIMNQILPSVEEILRIFNINKEDILSNNNQNTLSKFF